MQKEANISIRDGALAVNVHLASNYRAVEEVGFRPL